MMEDLSLASNSLRGATKTSSTGQPFAITLFGLSGRDLSSAWTIHCGWSPWRQASPGQPHARREPCTGFRSSKHSVQLNRSFPALATMRWAAQTPWSSAPCLTPGEASALTLHSLKVTYLSAALQFRLPEEDRRVQGHHKISSVCPLQSGRHPSSPLIPTPTRQRRSHWLAPQPSHRQGGTTPAGRARLRGPRLSHSRLRRFAVGPASTRPFHLLEGAWPHRGAVRSHQTATRPRFPPARLPFFFSSAGHCSHALVSSAL